MTRKTHPTRFWARWPVLLACLAFAGSALANVTATLTRAETTVGMPVQLQIEAEGSTNVVLPQEIEADGLQILRRGQQTRVEVINFRMRTSIVHIFSVIPTAEGTFTIPSINVTVDGKVQRTAPLELRVGPGAPGIAAPRAQPVNPGALPPGSVPGTQSSGADSSNERVAFAELVIPKKSAFVGEVIPVEFRFFFNASLPFEIQSRPALSGEGFTVQRLPDPTRGAQEIGGVMYNVFTFQTAITPLKSGTLEIPPVSLDCITQVPMSGGGNLNDLFNQFFSGSGVPGFGESREITVKSEGATLEVKPLPREGKPANFTGAVGEFEVSASADPTTVTDGEPITLSVTVTGRGNFDAMGEPKLIDADAWRTYPPASSFDPQDAIGYGGTKRFDFALVARESRDETPVAEFSYFDPSTEKYVTLQTKPIAVQAQAAAPSSTVATGAATPVADAPPPGAVATPTVDQADRSASPRSFSPWIHRPSTWFMQAVPLALVLGFLIAAWLRRRNSGPEGQLARARKARRHRLQQIASARDAAFLTGAARLVEADASAAGYRTPGDWLRSENAPRSALVLERMLAAADEIRFGGGAAVQVSEAERAEILAALKEVRR